MILDDIYSKENIAKRLLQLLSYIDESTKEINDYTNTFGKLSLTNERLIK